MGAAVGEGAVVGGGAVVAGACDIWVAPMGSIGNVCVCGFFFASSSENIPLW